MTKKKEIENRRYNTSSFSCNHCSITYFSGHYNHVRHGRP